MRVRVRVRVRVALKVEACTWAPGYLPLRVFNAPVKVRVMVRVSASVSVGG